LIKADIDSHFIEIKDGLWCCAVMISAFLTRGFDSVSEGWRKEIKEKFREKTRDFKPEIALHLLIIPTRQKHG
jgi:hypothetical protein